VNGSLESSSTGWLGKKDANSSHVILSQALAYATGNRSAGEVIRSGENSLHKNLKPKQSEIETKRNEIK
jgi:hypothetical protein